MFRLHLCIIWRVCFSIICSTAPLTWGNRNSEFRLSCGECLSFFSLPAAALYQNYWNLPQIFAVPGLKELKVYTQICGGAQPATPLVFSFLEYSSQCITILATLDSIKPWTPLADTLSCPVLLRLGSGLNEKAILFIFYFLNIYREGKGGGKRGKETSIDCFSPTPNRGPGLQPRHVPWPAMELVTFGFAGWCSIHWATPAIAIYLFFIEVTGVPLVNEIIQVSGVLFYTTSSVYLLYCVLTTQVKSPSIAI